MNATNTPEKKIPIIEVENLNVDFPIGNSFVKRKYVRAVNDVTFKLYKGESLAIVGESGSGKSTCARTLCKLNKSSGGSIRFKGKDIKHINGAAERKAYASSLQMVFQDPFGSLNPIRKIGHHLLRPLTIHNPKLKKHELQEKAYALLKRVGLTPVEETFDKYPHEVSGGQKQRVSIARALAVGADVILADEPISMLDVSIRIGILNLMEDMKKNDNIAFLYITHDIASARYFSERTAVMYVGYMVEWGDSELVINNSVHPYTKVLISAIPSIDRKNQVKEDHIPKSNIPLWTNESKGCPFASRCPNVMEICKHSFPEITEVEPNHFVRCFSLSKK